MPVSVTSQRGQAARSLSLALTETLLHKCFTDVFRV